MRKAKIGNLLIISHLILLSGCGGGLIPPEISSKPVELSIIRPSDGVGFVNQSGQVIIKQKFLDAKPFSDGLAAVKVENKEGKELWGFINHKGEFVIQPKYLNAEPFSDKLALVYLEKELTPIFIDQRGNVAIKPKEDWVFVEGFKDGLAPVIANNKLGFINHKGEIAIEPKFDGVRGFSNGLAFAQVGEGPETLGGYIDKSGKLSVPLEYKSGTDFAMNGAIVAKGGFGSYYTLIDRTGKTLKEKLNLSCGDPDSIKNGTTEGLLPVRLKLFGHCGYINMKGDIAIPPNRNFERAEPFSDGLAAVKIKDKWGYIDKTGSIVIEPKFEEISPFTNGLAFVKVNAANRGYINHSGQFVWQPVTF